MAHAFDTGLARPQRTLIRDGVVALLAGLLRTNGGYLQAVIPWGGVVRGYTDEHGIDMLFADLKGRSPAIAVALGDRVNTPAGMGGHSFKGDLELLVYHFNNHPGSLTAGRTASDAAALATSIANPGLDVQLEHAEELVLGIRVGGTLTTNVVGEKDRSTPSIKHIVATREEELLTSVEGTLWCQKYSITLDRKTNAYRGVTQMLTELRTVARPSDPAAADVSAADQVRPGDVVLETKHTTT